jgi:hypothetical protein
MMLEGEPDLERNVTNPPNVQTDQRLYVMIGFVAMFNAICSLNCDYKMQQYLLINSILYIVFSIYTVRKHMNIELFTVSFVIAIVVIFIAIAWARWVSDTCTGNACPVCQVCPTLKPTISPTNSTG